MLDLLTFLSLISCRGDTNKKKSNRISRLWNVETPDKSVGDIDISLTVTNDLEQNGNSVEKVAH